MVYFRVILLLLLGVFFAVSYETKLPKGLEQIGEFDDKIYFTDPDLNVDFYGAMEYCERISMESLTIDSEAEYEYLKSIFSDLTIKYWTSARDTNVFKWKNGTGSVLDNRVFNVQITHPTCVVFSFHLYADPCDGSLGYKYSPLCAINSVKLEKMLKL